MYLPLPSFLEKLRIEDESGNQLTYLPNDEVEAVLNQLRAENPDAYDRFIAKFSDTRYRLCLLLPGDKAIQPYDVRIFHLIHTDGIRPRYRNWSLLALPVFQIETRRLLHHRHSLFYIVEAPTDTELKVNVFDQEVNQQESYHATQKSDLHHVFSAHLPAPKEEPYSWKMNYWVGPTRLTRWALDLWFFVALLGGIWQLAAAFYAPVQYLLASQMGVVAAAFVATSAGLILSLHEAWANRYRALLVLTVVPSALAWLVRFGS